MLEFYYFRMNLIIQLVLKIELIKNHTYNSKSPLFFLFIFIIWHSSRP